MKKILLASLLACGLTAQAQTQEPEVKVEFVPHWYLQLQAGAAYTLGEAKFKDLISPTAQIAAGYQFNPWLGLRLQVSGWEGKGGWPAGLASDNPNRPTTAPFETPAYKYKWNYIAPEDGLYVMYASIKDGEDVAVYQNDREQTQKYGMARPYVAPIGYFKKGDKISVYADLKAGSGGKARVFVDLFNKDVFEEGYAKLSQSVMNTTELTASSMKGEIDAKQDGLFYTSIPYEEGWTAVVDGEKVDITPVGDAALAFPVTKGNHTIELTYYPKGFWPGFAISMVCLIVFAGMCVMIYIFKKRIIPEPAKLDIPEPDDYEE